MIKMYTFFDINSGNYKCPQHGLLTKYFPIKYIHLKDKKHDTVYEVDIKNPNIIIARLPYLEMMNLRANNQNMRNINRGHILWDF